MILDFSSGVSRRHHVAAGSFVWSPSFAAFGAVVIPTPKQGQYIGFLQTVGKLMNN